LTALENNFLPNFELIEPPETKDRLIKQLVRALLEEAGSPTLLYHLLKNYSPAGFKQKTSGGLSGYKLRRVSEFIKENIEDDLTLGKIAEIAGLSRFHFAGVSRQTTGLTPQQYVTQKRIENAKQLLAFSDLPLIEISLRSGFKNQSHFTTLFRKFTKFTPKTWRELKHA
jgi:AraC family transcriptional regulator